MATQESQKSLHYGMNEDTRRDKDQNDPWVTNFDIKQPKHKVDFKKKQRIVIVGSGPTGLGAAQRLYELGTMRSNTQVIILEQDSSPGGLATSRRDNEGFLWDMGGHVVFSHYKYFNYTLNQAVKEWNKHTRAAYVFMRGSDGKRRFIPYPVQENINAMSTEDGKKCLQGLEDVVQNPSTRKPTNFDEWLLMNFGRGLCEVFMRKYNRKVWTVNTAEMNADWVGASVAVPDVEKIRAKMASGKKTEDTGWSLNQFFRFPRYGGTGGIWRAIAGRLPRGWFYFNQTVTEVNVSDKELCVVSGDSLYHLKYDILINTSPLDTFLSMISDTDSTALHMKDLAKDFMYSHTHVLGIGLKGQPPALLKNKSWLYFPDSDSPFYRITVFSKYSDDIVPDPDILWSLMCEAAEPKKPGNPEYWTKENLLDETVRALADYGYISPNQVVSRYHRRLGHGYPIPFLRREEMLSQIQPWLESKNVFSRGHFGGWRYEVSSQDHSLMQGVEIADYLMMGTPEETYPDPSRVNSHVNPERFTPNVSVVPEYEFVIAHFNEDLSWLDKYSNHTHVYHKGKETVPWYQFRQWDRLPNVGREGHTYLHHIITSYDHLADVTVFLPGDVSSDKKVHTYSDLFQYVTIAKMRGESHKNKVSRMVHWGRIHHSNKNRVKLENKTMLKANLTLGEFWEEIFGYPHPHSVPVQLREAFAVSRKLIHRHPKSFYEKIMPYLNSHPDPEYGHYMERFWIAIFTRD